MENKLYIKNMVCDRCKMAVQQELDKSGLPYSSIALGEVVLTDTPAQATLRAFEEI